METQEIAQGEWAQFLDEFSKQHQGENATVQVIGEDDGVQTEAQSMPFVGISSEEKGSEKGAFFVMLGTEADDHVEHEIRGVSHLWQKPSEGSFGAALEMETTDGIKTILQLEPTPLLA